MAQWIEVKVRYEKTTETGKTVKVTDPYLVDALSCTEAEARVIEEIGPYHSEFNVLSASKTKISEVFWNGGDKFYKVKVNFITIDEKNMAERKTASHILVQAADFESALRNFNDGMKGTLADYEIESVAETKVVDVYSWKTAGEDKNPTLDAARESAGNKRVQRALKKLIDVAPDGGVISVSATGPGGRYIPETVIVDKSTPGTDDA